MPDYKLEGLSTRSFEQLVQTLAQKFIGARLTIYGDGPDGAREADYTGRFRLPPQHLEWNGHVVIQSKFLQTTYAKPKDNTNWLISQIDAELKKFAPPRSKSKTKFRSPDYYVLATNIKNSGVYRRGGKDRLTTLLNRKKEELGWLGWILWDGAEINRFLDQSEDIRRGYAAWITPGDVLMKMLSSIESSQPDFRKVMLARLQEDFTLAQYAKLRQAGHGAEEKTPLCRLFVDLPVAAERILQPPDESTQTGGKLEETKKLDTFLEATLAKGDVKLTPEALDVSVRKRARGRNGKAIPSIESVDEKFISGHPARMTFDHSSPGGTDARSVLVSKITNRIVLIGGPGQGKTTLGQFACQLYRAALLQNCTSPLLPETRDALNYFKQQCTSELVQPTGRRYPIWIDLKQVAKWLAGAPSEPPPSLLTYLSGRLGATVRAMDLEKWLHIYPWFVVFDGLDEVPASGGREQVISCIQSFVTQASSLGADLLILCTTRPQGYTRDFDERYYQHQWLVPLSGSRALAYGEKLLDARHGTSGDDRNIFGARLAQAASNETTARVMRSPLQVTIMAALVERVGRPPEQRWKLFREYYSVIYERERERGTEWSDVLAKFDPEINAIHRRIGWRLQVRSEKATNSDARLSIDEFNKDVRAELSKEGHEGITLDKLASTLQNAATDRLVFLVAIGSQEVGFEIRSLQEFMAADHLFRNGDVTAIDYIKRIAPISYWKNVFLFAAGRIFSEQRNLRDSLLGILDTLNEDHTQPPAKHILAGSILALDLLEDGVAALTPAPNDALMRKACRLLDIPLYEEHTRLALVAVRGSSSQQEILREEVERRLASDDQTHVAATASALRALYGLLPWATELVEQQFLNPGGIAQYLYHFAHMRKTSNSLRALCFEHLAKNSPEADPSFHYIFNRIEPPRLRTTFGLMIAAHLAGQRANLIVQIKESSGKKLPLRASLSALSKNEARHRNIIPPPRCDPDIHRDWQLIWTNAWFHQAPSKERLASAIDHLLTVYSWPIPGRTLRRVCWPLLAALNECSSADDAKRVSLLVREGHWGDIKEWRETQEIFHKSGATVSEILDSISESAASSLKHQAGNPNNSARILFLRLVQNVELDDADVADDPSAAGDKDFNSVLIEVAARHPEFGYRMLSAFWWGEVVPNISAEAFFAITNRVTAAAVPVSGGSLTQKLISVGSDESFPQEWDDLGLKIREINLFDEESPTEAIRLTRAVVHAIKDRPSKLGLWRLLSLLPPFTEHGCYEKILEFCPTEFKKTSDYTALRICSLSWKIGDVPAIASEILAAAATREDIFSRLAEVLAHAPGGNADIEALPIELLRKSPKTHTHIKRTLIEAIRVLHTKRSSGFRETENFPPE